MGAPFVHIWRSRCRWGIRWSAFSSLLDVQPDRFGEHEERLIAILAAQAAQAVASAQRYAEDDEHLQSRLLQLRSLQRISRELTSTLYLHNILDFALKEALRATHATQGTLHCAAMRWSAKRLRWSNPMPLA